MTLGDLHRLDRHHEPVVFLKEPMTILRSVSVLVIAAGDRDAEIQEIGHERQPGVTRCAVR